MNISAVSLLQVTIALIAGLAVAYQPGMNARLAKVLPHPLHAAIISFFCGFAVLVVAAIAIRTSPPQLQKLGAVPWWGWLGGVLGAFFVTAATILVPKIGSTSYLACIIAGQLIGSVLIDQFGHMGLDQHPFSTGRALGILLLIAGVVCIKAF